MWIRFRPTRSQERETWELTDLYCIECGKSPLWVRKPENVYGEKNWSFCTHCKSAIQMNPISFTIWYEKKLLSKLKPRASKHGKGAGG